MRVVSVWLLVASIILVSCGKKDGASPQANQSKWSNEQLTKAQSGCVDQILTPPSSTPKSQAENYCSCMFTKISGTWSFDDFSTNNDKYLAQLETDGTAKGCVDRAGQ